jgi:hypothetical protein
MGYSPANLEAENGALTRAADSYEEEKVQKACDGFLDYAVHV